MNLAKINAALTRYIEKVRMENIPNVYSLYRNLGEEVMGRKIYATQIDQAKEYFNKCIYHKRLPSYIGKPSKDFFAEDILDMNKFEESRRLVVNCNPSSSNPELRTLVEMINAKYGIENYVIDVFYERSEKYEHKIGKNGMRLMELNEIHLASITKEQLDFIYQNIL